MRSTASLGIVVLLLVTACETPPPSAGGGAEVASSARPGRCDPAKYPFCEQNVLYLCQDGALVTVACGTHVCNAAEARCGVCGDGALDPGEACDDANLNDGDGCRSDCTLAPLCDPATFQPRCEGNTLVRCEHGVEVAEDCGASRTCNPLAASCGYCGDGALDPGEECDYPDRTDGDGCDTNCTLSRCGNGVRAGDEVCDDGNVTGGDGCRADCGGLEICGDGILDEAVGEECDAGSINGYSYCTEDCRLFRCGDGIQTQILLYDEPVFEVCDDGNTEAGDGCRADCLGREVCGDGLVDEAVGEVCDGGEFDDWCAADCSRYRACGDGFVDAPEQCDDGNQESGDGCNENCILEGCGNGLVESGESCDDGNTEAGDGCGATCIVEFCGNGILDPGEVCDDGNTESGDACASDCGYAAACGNFIVDGMETCDDGNTAGGDGCSATCQREICGDGVLDVGEACDDGNLEAGDGCRSDCLGVEVCGDGLVDAGETCDDGNQEEGDGCSPTCQVAACLDGYVDSGELCFHPAQVTPVAALPEDGDEPIALAITDVNGDGLADVVTANAWSHNLSVLRSDGAGGFATPTHVALPARPDDIEAGDLDADGRPDLLVAAQGLCVIRIAGDDTVPACTLYPSAGSRLRVADVDADGFADVVGALGTTISVYLGNGDGTLDARTSFVQSVTVRDFAVADLDADGRPELILVSTDSAAAFVLPNLGGGAFGPGIEQPFRTTGRFTIVAGDLDADGVPDLLAGGTGSNLGLLWNNGPPSYFHRPFDGVAVYTGVVSVPMSVAIADMDGDGHPELLAGDYGSGAVNVLRPSEGVWRSATLADVGGSIRDMAVADLNGDGRPDIAAALAADDAVGVSLGSPD